MLDPLGGKVILVYRKRTATLARTRLAQRWPRPAEALDKASGADGFCGTGAAGTREHLIRDIHVEQVAQCG